MMRLIIEACATAAMRDAENGYDVVARVRKESRNKRLKLLMGKQKPILFFKSHRRASRQGQIIICILDIGGGSTEITLFSKTKWWFRNLSNIGTIRRRCMNKSIKNIGAF